jgi:ubiquitin-protein ligase
MILLTMSTCGDSGGRSNTETSLDELQAPLVETFIDEEHSDNNHDDNFWNNEIDDHDHEDDDDYVYYDDDFESIEEITNTEWREPSKDAVNMSLRAEKETSGSKRRLAQDLYRIMIQDTQDAGFALRPTTEDCLDEWIVNLFNFDEDSRLAKDMLVLGVASIELSMSFPEQYPFEPPFVCILKPRFERSTGFVIKGALCMELLTKVRLFQLSSFESNHF